MRYELRELEGTANVLVRKWNPHIPSKKPIFGVFDKENNCFIVEDEYSPSYYFWIKRNMKRGDKR